jgi:hypothetical protein
MTVTQYMETLFVRAYTEFCKDEMTNTVEHSRFKNLVHDTYIVAKAQEEEKKRKEQEAAAEAKAKASRRSWGF